MNQTPISVHVDAEVFDIAVDDLIDALKDHQDGCGFCTSEFVCEFGQVRLNAFIRAYNDARRELAMWNGRQPTDITVYRARKRRYRGAHRVTRRTSARTVLVSPAS
jgi:hypothetical protein